MTGNDQDIDRFVRAQANGVYDRALAEIRSGCKRGYWMWFIFPQAGLSAASKYYGIKSLAEAVPRLPEINTAVLEIPHFNPAKVFGYPDDLKLRSSLTHFNLASPNDIFGRALAKCFDDPDEKSVRIVSGWVE